MLLQQFERMRGRLFARDEKALQAAVPILSQAIANEAPVRTGRLVAGLDVDVQGKSLVVTGEAPYTKHVIDGKPAGRAPNDFIKRAYERVKSQLLQLRVKK